MAKESFRFIHASDFHLERPLQDVLDLPEHLQKTLVEAPWKAAEAVFEHAIIENVDFVILSGDLLNPASCGAAGIAFLLQQFELLKERQIAVYWVTGDVDSMERWPEAVSLPSNVRVFSSHETESVVHRRNEVGLATIIGRSSSGNEIIHAAEFANETSDSFVVAAAHGIGDSDSLSAEHVDYWALGGRHQADILRSDEPVIRYPGSTQARSLKEHGEHGFVMVDIDAQQNIQVHSIAADLVRYSSQDIDADDMALGRDVRQILAKRIARIQSEAAGRHTLVRWRVHMDLENASVVGPSALEDLLGWLRREFGHSAPCCWSTDIQILPPEKLPTKWQEEDTILGDFLRTAAESKKDSKKHLELKSMIDTETPGANVWHSMLSASSNTRETSTLDRSTLLGVDLLRGHQVDLAASTRRFGGSQQ